MPRNGSGSYTLPQPPFTPGTTISSTAVNSDFSDIAAALTASVAADGQTSITVALKNPSGTAATPGVSFGADATTGMYLAGSKQLGLAAGGVEVLQVDANLIGSGQTGNLASYGNGAILNPVGSVLDFAGATAPAGWLLCAGQSLTITSYPELFQIISNTYGGDGITTFAVPDCRGRAGFGKDNMGGSAANRITVAGGNFDGTVLGGAGGQQNHAVAQANLPNVSFTFTGTPGLGNTVNVSPTQIITTSSGGPTLASGVGVNAAAVTATVTLPSYTPAGTVASGGSGTALPVLSPAIIFNKIIFAGRP